jgi:uncharacterized protein with HEPN domain
VSRRRREVGDYLADMARYAETAVRLVAGMTLEQVAADERTSLALERAIEILGEAAAGCRRSCAPAIRTCPGGR